jgi:hypothetical protein
MLQMIRRRHHLGLATANQTWMNDRLDNIAQLVDQIRALPDGASAKELTARLLSEAEEADARAGYVDDFTAKASR